MEREEVKKPIGSGKWNALMEKPRLEISDTIWDFGAMSYVWCKFMFPNKPPTNGLYPYYSHCHVHDYINNFFCYDKANHSTTVNSMVTGFWDNDFVFWTFAPSDVIQPYKCCRVPLGYYIDYISCYFLPTHDPFFEYYDGNFFLVNCATGYVVTGISAKPNPNNQERRIDWIQCCRLGYGQVFGVSPPIINVKNRPPAYTTANNIAPAQIPQGYAHQYRKKRSVGSRQQSKSESFNETFVHEDYNDGGNFIPFWKSGEKITDHDVPVAYHPNIHGPDWSAHAGAF